MRTYFFLSDKRIHPASTECMSDREQTLFPITHIAGDSLNDLSLFDELTSSSFSSFKVSAKE